MQDLEAELFGGGVPEEGGLDGFGGFERACGFGDTRECGFFALADGWPKAAGLKGDLGSAAGAGLRMAKGVGMSLFEQVADGVDAERGVGFDGKDDSELGKKQRLADEPVALGELAEERIGGDVKVAAGETGLFFESEFAVEFSAGSVVETDVEMVFLLVEFGGGFDGFSQRCSAIDCKAGLRGGFEDGLI